MSEISQKSISGITSITTPAGVDNQFTLHTNDTSQAAKLDAAGNFHFSNHVNTTGITSASNFKTGSSDLHSTGLTVGNTLVHSTGVNASSMDIDDFVDVGNNIKLGNAGVITATSFVGDGSDLTNLPAGLGTALSATATSPLNKMYYTNAVLGIAATTTVDVPASASAAYTQYADINIATDADLIIAEGDDLIPDVLGLADFGTFGGGTAGRLRVSSISNHTANGAPTVQHGLVITGVTTSTTFSGSGASLTNLNGSNIASGTVPVARIGTGTKNTSTFYRGDGTFATVTSTTINNNANDRIITGSGTANTLEGEANLTYDGTNLRLGTTTAAISAGKGLMIADAAGARIKLCDSDQGVTASDGFEIIQSNGGNAFIYNRENSPIIFGTNNTERMRITHEGSVGIGTDGSTYELEVHDGTGAAALRMKDGANNVICDLIANSNGGLLRTTYNHPLIFHTNQTERLRIDTSGTVTAVGIVTATVCLGAEGTAFKYDTITQISNIDITNSYATTSTYYKWVLPSAGLYMLQSSMRVRMWGTTGYIQTRLYDNTASSALSNSERMMWEQQGLSGQYTNVNITLSWVINVASGRTIYQQFRTSNQTTGNGIQRDGNGHNYMFWQKLS